MKQAAVLLFVATLAALSPLRAGERFVTSGADYDVNDPLVPNTLRGELELAQSGDTIHIAKNLVVNLYDRLVIPAGKDNLTITGPEIGSAQIRAIIERGDNSQNNSITVQGDNLLFRKLTFRDVSVVIGDINPSMFVVEGGTVRDCSFVLRSNLTFAHMNNGLAERCVLKVARFEIGSGAIDVVGGDGTQVRECEITLLGAYNASEQALVANRAANVTFEDNVLTNGDLTFHPKSGKAIDNTLKNRVFDFFLQDGDQIEGPGPYEIVGNECGALFVQGRNFIIRENIMSGRIVGRPAPGVQAIEGDPGSVTPFAMVVTVIDGPPVEVFDNIVNGGINGVVLDVGPSATSAKFATNQIRNVKKQGLIVVAYAPVEISHNTIERCGSTSKVKFGPYPTPALHLRDCKAAVTVKQNTLRNSRGVGILAHDGSPVFDTNLIAGGVATGIMFYDDVTPVFTGVNRVERMVRSGVVVKAGADILIEGMVFDRNFSGGLSVEPGAKVLSRNNTFTGQLGPGLKLMTEAKTGTTKSIARARVEGGTFTLNRGPGVLVGKGGSCEIIGGAFTDNVGPGIDLVPAGVTPNAREKGANGNMDFPDQLTFDEATRVLRGKAEPGALVQMYRVEKSKRRGNPKNGEGAMAVGSTTATGEGDFSLPPGPTSKGDMFTFTATRPATGVIAVATSEFSENIEVPPSPPVELISQSSNEEAGNGVSLVNDWNVGEAPQVLMSNTSVSADGRFVLFHSVASNLVNDDTNNAPDLFLRDRSLGTTERVNVATGGAQAGPNVFGQPARVGHGSISADGRWLVFASESTNLVADDSNSGADIFLRDRQTGTTIAVTDPSEQPDMSVRSGGWDCSISADGNVVAFVTRDNRFTGAGINGEHRVVVWTRGTGQFEEVNPGPVAPAFFHNPRLSADGRCVVFSTRARLVAEDTDSRDDVYLRDRQAGTTERISIATEGAAMGGASPSISADGRFVAFTSASSGEVADTNGKGDIYVRDRQLSTTSWASQPPAGLDPMFGGDCGFPSISADGRFVAYQAEGSTTRPDELTVIVEDIYTRDRQLGATIEVNIGVGGDVRGNSALPVMSSDGRQVIFGGDGLGFTPGDVQPLSEVFARALTPEDFTAP
jgi:Tol biopolymer transport system component